MVVPAPESLRTYVQRSRRSSTSTPAVGSSRKSTGGRGTSALAERRRRLLPPEDAGGVAGRFVGRGGGKRGHRGGEGGRGGGIWWKRGGGEEEQGETRLYVGNLPFDATEKQIRSFMEGEGRTVTAIKIVTDRDTGRSRGFAFVDLEDADQVQRAISELNGKDFGGRALIVNEAQDKGPGQRGSGFRAAFAEERHA